MLSEMDRVDVIFIQMGLAIVVVMVIVIWHLRN